MVQSDFDPFGYEQPEVTMVSTDSSHFKSSSYYLAITGSISTSELSLLIPVLKDSQRFPVELLHSALDASRIASCPIPEVSKIWGGRFHSCSLLQEDFRRSYLS